MAECVYCNFNIGPELKTIEMYTGKDKEGHPYYYLDIERPEGFIPDPWRNRRLYIRYCPLCGRKLNNDYTNNCEWFTNLPKEDLAEQISTVVFETLEVYTGDEFTNEYEKYKNQLIDWFTEEYEEED